jgi:hypothetical protein
LSFQVELTHTPGATTSTVAPQLEKPARVSSVSLRHEGGPPVPPGSPSVSARAATVTTSGWLAGWKVAASTLLLPAAATIRTPALVAPVTASATAWLWVSPPRLTLATEILSAWAAV